MEVDVNETVDVEIDSDDIVKAFKESNQSFSELNNDQLNKPMASHERREIAIGLNEIGKQNLKAILEMAP